MSDSELLKELELLKGVLAAADKAWEYLANHRKCYIYFDEDELPGRPINQDILMALHDSITTYNDWLELNDRPTSF